MKKQQKKISFQSVAFGCTVLSAVLIGAWFLFPVEEVITARFPSLKFTRTKSGNEDPIRAIRTGLKPKTGDPSLLQAERISRTDPVIQAGQHAQEGSIESLPPGDRATDPSAAVGETGQTAEEQELLLQTGQEPPKTPDRAGWQPDQAVAEHLDRVIRKLSAKPPAVLRETDDLYTVLANTAHLFRVLGKEDIQFIKELLQQEQGRIENIAAELHDAVLHQQAAAGRGIRIPLETAYEYAGFFLHTMGGRSYLFRRPAKTRLLISYYAVRIIDEANSRGLNAYGIDVGETLPLLIRDMEGTTQLTGKDRYLKQLYRLQGKYPTGP